MSGSKAFVTCRSSILSISYRLQHPRHRSAQACDLFPPVSRPEVRTAGQPKQTLFEKNVKCLDDRGRGCQTRLEYIALRKLTSDQEPMILNGTLHYHSAIDQGHVQHELMSAQMERTGRAHFVTMPCAPCQNQDCRPTCAWQQAACRPPSEPSVAAHTTFLAHSCQSVRTRWERAGPSVKQRRGSQDLQSYILIAG